MGTSPLGPGPPPGPSRGRRGPWQCGWGLAELQWAPRRCHCRLPLGLWPRACGRQPTGRVGLGARPLCPRLRGTGCGLTPGASRSLGGCGDGLRSSPPDSPGETRRSGQVGLLGPGGFSPVFRAVVLKPAFYCGIKQRGSVLTEPSRRRTRVWPAAGGPTLLPESRPVGVPSAPSDGAVQKLGPSDPGALLGSLPCGGTGTASPVPTPGLLETSRPALAALGPGHPRVGLRGSRRALPARRLCSGGGRSGSPSLPGVGLTPHHPLCFRFRHVGAGRTGHR